MKKILFSIIGIVILGVAWYGLSPLFMNKRVDDTLPVAVQPSKPENDSSKNDTASQEKPMESEAFPIVDTPAHPASGQVRIIQTGDETIVRYENYKTINGPDVRVYLAKDLDAKEYVDLGPLKGTEGNINYSIPKGVKIADYKYALTWCEDFAVLFNSADLSPKK
ncbi:MAG: DM13 domain-containing protein [Candidatus Moraniibacteriota bacterium]